VPLLFGFASLTVCGLCWERPASGLLVYNVTEVLRGGSRAIPDGGLSYCLPFFFTFVVPVAFLTTVPAEAMLVVSSLAGGAGVLAWVLWRVFWQFALRFYTSASS